MRYVSMTAKTDIDFEVGKEKRLSECFETIFPDMSEFEKR